MRRIARLAALGAAFLAAANGPARAEDVGWSGPRSLGQRLYVPVSSSIHAMEDRLLDLAVTVSVCNTGAEHSIRVEAMRYFGDQKQESCSTEPCLMGRTRLLFRPLPSLDDHFSRGRASASCRDRRVSTTH